jgi:hypothetical protein
MRCAPNPAARKEGRESRSLRAFIGQSAERQTLKLKSSAAWNGICVPTKPVLLLLSHIAYGYFNWIAPAAACASVPPVGDKKLDGRFEYEQIAL